MQRRKQVHKGLVLGIDIGSVSITIVCIDPEGRLKKQVYALHLGNIRSTLDKMMEAFQLPGITGIATPSGKAQFTDQVKIFNREVSLMEAVSWFDLKARSILHVGAERFFLIELDSDGTYLQTSHSSSCAAGTGSFLDQQAMRLQLKDAAHLSDMALQNKTALPDIAARCSVFAKTDLIHAQQQGYGLEAICDSLCKGLADNISDTLFNKTIPESPIFMSGGVSKNHAVVKHLQRFIGKEINIHSHSHLFPAIGAAHLLLKEIQSGKSSGGMDSGNILRERGKLQYYFEPLHKKDTESREFRNEKQYIFHPKIACHTMDVQVNQFKATESGVKQVYLGIDVGSTSTKAVVLGVDGNPLAGFYTYTSGQPLKAVQALFESIDNYAGKSGGSFKIMACSTTGSGRKFIGEIIRADQTVDEITAHARAAYELNPKTDTIIEIGGQDAKFTQMKEGVVTFSHMNTVCAAGTGSFIEELAGRLEVSLEDYERLALDTPAPLASDRCTVFMERDINQLLSMGHTVKEVLATVIHSVRENYLKKVASEAHIGNHICFQGATAKNRALVAAFEQRLKKPIFVSPLCHLTGALGAALLLKEEHTGRSGFRGLDLFRKSIPITTETCQLCLNRCTISVAMINGEKQAYGFLCGRDYDTQKFVSNRKIGFELLKERKRLIKKETGSLTGLRGQFKVGIPASLHLLEDLPYWTVFFRELGIQLHSSEDYKDSLKSGKKIAGAEFCAPIDSMYGHVDYLARTCDYIFMPVYLESRIKAKNREENYCYYTQYSASLAFLEGEHVQRKLISPMLNFNKSNNPNIKILTRCLVDMGYKLVTPSDVSRAVFKAEEYSRQLKLKMEDLFVTRHIPEGDVSVVLMGRPYVVLSETLNKGIPDILTRMGVMAWYQDMLPEDKGYEDALENLLKKIPWHFAANILRATEKVARTKNLYPILITAFKCAPDSFIIDYFKQLMHLFGKPYLIIQIDEHDSNVGYETRIEAALRSFSNHARSAVPVSDPNPGSILPKVDTRMNGKTVLLPNWDMFVSPLIVANLRRAGFDARLLETSDLSIRRSMAHNTGQCLPINIVAQDCIDFIEKHKLDPSDVILWMFESKLSCNIRQYPFYIKSILENYGKGLERANVYSGDLAHRELSVGITYYAYFAYMLGGLFRQVSCRIRPYESVPGQTDAVFKKVHKLLVKAMEGDQSIETAISNGLKLVDEIEYDSTIRKPLVAIFGDLYVRDNDVMNQDLIKTIEQAGGEALVTPYHEYTKIIMENIFRRAAQRGEHVETSLTRILLNIVRFMDERHYKPFRKYLGPAPVINPRVLEKHLSSFNIHLYHSGESYDNILKIFYIIENHPEVALFVQTNPSFCCPSLVTEAMTRQIRKQTGVPIVTITYDGTSESMNDAIVPYIQKNRVVL